MSENIDKSEDDFIDDTMEETKRSGFKLRMKKYLSTKTAATSIGRTIIINSLGKNGEQIYTLLMESLNTHYGKKKSSEIRDNMLRMTLKIKILLDEKIVPSTSLLPAEKPFRDFCIQLLRDVSIENEYKLKDKPVSPMPLRETLVLLEGVLLEIFHGVIKPKNIKRIQEVFENMSEKEFIVRALNHESEAQLRRAVRDGLYQFTFFSSYFKDPSKIRKCEVISCPHNEYVGKGLFKSTGYCETHHKDKFGEIVSDPKLKHFIDQSSALSVYFVDFLQSKRMYFDSSTASVKVETSALSPELFASMAKSHSRSMFAAKVRNPVVDNEAHLIHYYYFIVACAGFNLIESSNLRNLRAEKIVSRYLLPKVSMRYCWFPAALIDDVKHSLAERKVRKSLFEDLVAYSRSSVLDQVFADFLQSVYYERSIITIKL